MIHFNKKLVRHVDLSVLLIALGLVAVGLVAIASATHFNIPDSYSLKYLQVQTTATFLGIIAIFAIMLVDYRWFKEYSGVIYLITIGVLTFTMVLARTVSGAKSWFSLGPVNIQPSEVAKLTMILVLAAYIADREDEMKYFSGMFKAGLVMGLPTLLVLAQNDLGTALVYIAIYIGMLFVGGGNARVMATVLLVSVALVMGLVVATLYTDIEFPFLKEYQLQRLQVLIDPWIAPHSYGYNIIQSEIAIGSGQAMGKGLFKGTQNQLRFLPEKHTDFIFSVIGEEFGFVGGFVVLCLYLSLLLRSVVIAREARDSYGSLIVVGVVSMWMFHVLENVGMTIGVMPVTGIPLPFISYGGSSMASNMFAVGLIMNVRMRKQKILF